MAEFSVENLASKGSGLIPPTSTIVFPLIINGSVASKTTTIDYRQLVDFNQTSRQ